MTPGNDPLICSCGDHSAVYVPPKKKQKERWMVKAVKAPGQKPQVVTNKVAKGMALQRVREDCAKSALAIQPATAEAPLDCYKYNMRNHNQVKYDDTVRTASHPAGPGRGHKRKPETVLGQAEDVLKKPKANAEELRAVLVKLCSEHRLLQQWYQKMRCERDRAFSLLADEYSLGADEKRDAVKREDRRKMVTELVGEGYCMTGSKRTYERHKALALGAVKQIAGGDAVKEQQLAEALISHYSAGKEAHVEAGSAEYEAHSAVVAGLVEELETLRRRNNGRYPTKDRITQEVILSAVTRRAKGKVLSAVSRLLKQRPQTMRKAADRADPDSFFVEDEKSTNAYDPAWAEFIVQCWDDLTRASECAKDEARDPVAHSSGAHATHRKHWINTRLDDLRDIMVALGKEEFGEDFHLSKPKMLDLKKYYHQYPGRETCLCRYHMEFDNHFYALRKYKASVRQSLPQATRSVLPQMPGSPRELRQHLQCEKEGEYYKQHCADRTCVRCVGKLEKLVSKEEMEAAPMIKYQHWSEIPYVTKDGRVIKNHDFLPAELPIADFLKLFNSFLREFLPHHNHAKYLDNDWKKVWDNVSRADDFLPTGVEHWWQLPEDKWIDLKVANQFGTVIDYANSYQTEHKLEHMQQFWSHSSTTILGNVLKVPVSKLRDEFFADRAEKSGSGRSAREERMEVLRALAEFKLPPEIIVMHMGITSNPHHDTAGIQHFFRYHLYPWLAKYTLFRGARHLVRSDGCSGQMKSGRHFRFIANFHTHTDWNLGTVLIWSHSESCRGKDLSDPECGRAKFILRCHEMRHTDEDSTMLKTSREQYNHLNAHHCLTRRSLREKRSRGIYIRVFHWMEPKSIKPLKDLAEVNTLTGSCTLESHFFINHGVVGSVKIRKIACLTCDGCKGYRYGQCRNSPFCGPLLTKQIKLKSGGRDSAIETRHCTGLQESGERLASQVSAGTIVGSECTNEAEPYIISLALAEEATWHGEDDTNWMGKIVEGTCTLRFLAHTT